MFFISASVNEEGADELVLRGQFDPPIRGMMILMMTSCNFYKQ